MLELAVTARPKKVSLTSMIIAASIGNALEWYDISIYLIFSLQIAKAFFPAQEPAVSLMMTFGTLGISYIARPIGAIVLGAYADRVGRKSAMLVCIALMALGTGIITFMPTYATIGSLAPVGIVIARLVQAFSAGGEFGSATALLVESSPERRGFIASWQFASQGMSAVLATLFGVLVSACMSANTLQDWGWRIPFAFGLLVAPVGLYIRRQLDEVSPSSEKKTEGSAIVALAGSQKTNLIVATGCLAISTSATYLLFYMPTYAVKNLKLTPTISFTAALCGSLILAFLTPFAGHLSDRFGPIRIMLGSAIIMGLSFYPCFVILTSYPSLSTIIAVVVWIACLKATYFGGLPALMADLFPAATRATGLSLSYSVGVTAFGGFAPLVMVWLITFTRDDRSPSYYLLTVTLLSIVALITARRKFGMR